MSVAPILNFIAHHWELIAALIGFLFPSTGILVWLNRRNKTQAEVKENELIAYAPPERARMIKDTKAKKQKNDLIIFVLNTVLMLGILTFINILFSQNITLAQNIAFAHNIEQAIVARELEWMKTLAFFQIWVNLIVLSLFAARLVSSISTFDSLLNALPIIKNFVKK